MITAGSNNGAKCILVVDDEPSIVGAIAASLRCSGLHVDEATCGQAALESAKARPPHLTVLDTTLPDFDSLELARRLRAFGIAFALSCGPRLDQSRGRRALGGARRLSDQAFCSG